MAMNEEERQDWSVGRAGLRKPHQSAKRKKRR
jgi:hypothetical protein